MIHLFMKKSRTGTFHFPVFMTVPWHSRLQGHNVSAQDRLRSGSGERAGRTRLDTAACHPDRDGNRPDSLWRCHPSSRPQQGGRDSRPVRHPPVWPADSFLIPSVGRGVDDSRRSGCSARRCGIDGRATRPAILPMA